MLCIGQARFDSDALVSPSMSPILVTDMSTYSIVPSILRPRDKPLSLYDDDDDMAESMLKTFHRTV